MLVFSRITKSDNHTLISKSLLTANKAFRQGHFRQAAHLFVKEIEAINRKLDFINHRPDLSVRAHSIKQACQRQLMIVAKRILIAIFLNDKRSLIGIRRQLYGILRKSKQLRVIRAKLNKRAQRQLLQEVELAILMQNEALDQAQMTANRYDALEGKALRAYRLQAHLQRLERLQRQPTANQAELAKLCLTLVKEYQAAAEPSLAYVYQRQHLVYRAGSLPQKLAAAKEFVAQHSPASLSSQERQRELVFLKTKICMFDFQANYHDFNSRMKYLHDLAAELRQCRYYDQRQYRIVKSWLILSTHLVKLPQLSVSSLQTWLRRHASQPARLNGEQKPEVRQAYDALQAVRRFVYILQHRRATLSSGSKELNALAKLYHQRWLSQETVLQCLVNFVQNNRLQIVLETP